MNAASTESRAADRVGKILKDKWRLDALLGVGGMAVVYSATHRNQKRVAIKMLLPELAGDAEIRSRFVREGYAANTIEHPGALSVLDDDVTDEGLPFLVMELLDGETVEARWARNGQQLEVAEVLSIAAAVLDVLAFAHAKGVVHRDIKPENLFLLRSGGLKVLDFGIARVLEGTRANTATRAGTVMGTPAFMAPEQALAKWDEVDGRTDLWAVAATMFTLLSGQHVHEGANGNEQFVKSATQPARSVASVVTGLPRSVIALIDRALRFDRTVRWPDARAMQDAVRGAYEAVTGAPLILEAPTSGQGAWSSRSGEAVPSGVVDRGPPGRTVVGTGPTSSRGGPPGPPGPPPARRMSGQQQLQPTLAAGKAPPPPPPRTAIGAGPSAVARRQSTSFENQGPPAVVRRQSTSFENQGPPPVSRRQSASFENLDPLAMDVGGPALAPPPMTALSMDAFIAQRTAERDAAAAEVARYQPVVTEIQSRLAAVRRRAAQAQEQIAATRKDRTAEDEKFRRQMNARLEGVGEARKDFRRAMGDVARIALEDTMNFPPDVGAADRANIERTGGVAAARAREDALHQAALTSYDQTALKRGVALSVTAVVLFLVLFFSPVIVRSCASDTGTMASPPSGSP